MTIVRIAGERFMSMFDDYDEHAAHAGPYSQAQAQAGGKSHKAKQKKGGGKQKDAQPFSTTPAKAQPQGELHPCARQPVHKSCLTAGSPRH